MSELIYSGSKVPDKGGRVAVNPVHFTGPVAGVKCVYLNGDYPKIKAAYEEVGVKVSPISDMPEVKKTASVAAEKKGA